MLARALLVIGLIASVAHGSVDVDLSRFDAACGVAVSHEDSRVVATWPMEQNESGAIVLNLTEGTPLVEAIAIVDANRKERVVVNSVDPVLVLTVGTRNLNDKAGWVAFFDNPPKRPYEVFGAKLAKKSARIESRGKRATISIGEVKAGPFRGEWTFTFYPGARIVQVSAVMSTQKDACAITYDLGLAADKPSWHQLSWVDNQDVDWQGDVDLKASSHAVRRRAIVATSVGGSLAIFPPPHQFLYPLDFAENFEFVWSGRGWRDRVAGTGFGVRQTIEGDKRYVPWINAPPGTQQRLSAFLLLHNGPDSASIAVQRFTRGDRFKKLDGYKTFSSHYHIEHTLEVDKNPDRRTGEPGFVKTFQNLGVDIVHLGEFHVHHTPEMNARRLELLKLMHEECARLSSDEFLLLPGEEPNVHLGGHWISFFPKPVYWTLQRGKDQTFSEQIEGFGTVYHIGSAEDVLKLMEAEHGLMWTAHPRIKGSLGFPDAYRQTAFYKSDRFLGGAWKAMPADLSLPRLGTRVLDLLDDMNNWGDVKFTPGEVDVFKVEPDYEMYGHMNVNYLKLDRIPRFADGWQPVLDALRAGEFFVTTGEVLIPSWRVDRERGEVVARAEWTFPPAFAEVISGDGMSIFRERLDLSDRGAFGEDEIRIPIRLKDRTWVRLEVWDVAANGAFTQPIRLGADQSSP